MANNHDDLGFQPLPQANNDHSDLGFQPISNDSKVSLASVSEQPQQDDVLTTLGDAGLGAVQGATFGFGDEILGGIGAAGDALSGKTTLENLVESYRQNRDAARAKFKEAEERSPIASTVGNLAGGVLPALLSGGAGLAGEASALGRIGTAIKAGAGAGALAGVGNSEADVTKGEAVQTLKDALMGGYEGAKAGAILGTGIEAAKGIGSGIKNTLKDSKLAQDIAKSFKYGTEGTNLVSSSGLDAAEQGTREAADKLALAAREANKNAGSELGAARKAVEASGQKFDVSEQINKVKEVIELLKNSDNPEAMSDVAKLQSYLDNLLLGKEQEISAQASKFNPGKIVEASPSAEEKLMQELAKENASRAALGQAPLKGAITRSVDEQGNPLLTLAKTADEQIGAAERAIDVKDKEGNIVDTLLNHGDDADNFKSTAKAKTVLDTPAQEAKYVPGTPGEEFTATQARRVGGNDPSQVSYSKAQDIRSTLNNLSGSDRTTPSLKTNEAINASKQAAGGIKNAVDDAAGLGTATLKSQKSYQALDVLGIDPQTDFQTIDGQKQLTTAAKQKINNVVRRMARDTDAGENAAVKIKDALNFLKEVDPKAASELEPGIQRASEVLDLAQKAHRLGLLNKSTYLKSGTIDVANRVGLGVKKLADATAGDLQNIAKDLVSKGSPHAMRLAQNLADAAKKDNVGRNAAIFALQQNPTYREMLKEYENQNK